MLIDELKLGSITTIIGSGGKTSTVYRLGEKLYERNQSVLLTTTTGMLVPESNPNLKVIIEPDIEMLYKYLSNMDDTYKVFAAKYFIKDDKVKGYENEELMWLKDKIKNLNIIVEGDGSDGKSLKIPEKWEPVVPKSTELTIVVVGWDIIGKPIEEKWIYRSYLLERNKVFNNINKSTDYVNEKMLIKLLENPKGLLKGIPESSTVILLLNKVITYNEIKEAKKMASEVLKKIPQIKKVALGEIRDNIVLIER